MNFDATIIGDREHLGNSAGSTKAPSTISQTSKSSQTTKSSGIQNDELDFPSFEEDYAIIPASGDKDPYTPRPHYGQKSG